MAICGGLLLLAALGVRLAYDAAFAELRPLSPLEKYKGRITIRKLLVHCRFGELGAGATVVSM